MKNTKGKIQKISAVAVILLVIASFITVVVNADNSKSYVVDVINAQETSDGVDNSEIKIQKQILKDNSTQPYYDDKNLTYQVTVTNTEVKNAREVAIVVDTSYSMDVNDSTSMLKSKAVETVEKIYAESSNTKIQIFNASGSKSSKLAYSNSNQTTLVNTINGLVAGEGNNIADGLEAARTSFTAGDDIEKYIILFTDATDSVKTALNNIQSNDIKIFSILVNNIVSDSYITSNKPTVGKVQMVYSSSATDADKIYDEFNLDTIVNIINKSNLNTKITDTFTEAFKEYFDFEFISVSAGNLNDVTQTSDGYIWEIGTLKSGETRTLKYKLNIKDNIEITDPQYLYHELNTSESVLGEYSKETYESDTIDNYSLTLKKEDTPIVKICDKYSVTLKAVSEENDGLTIEGVNFKVIAKDKAGNIVYNKTLTTNKYGEVVVDNLKTTDTVHFEITPSVNKIGYDKTDTAEIDITNNFGKDFTVEPNEWNERSIVNNDTRNITITMPINTKKFTLEVDLTEANNSNAVIGGSEFRLIQPKLNSKYEMQAKYAETDEQGKIYFEPSIMTEAGTYQYILSQLTVQDGYISMGNVTLEISFDSQGNVIENGIKALYNDGVTAKRINNAYCLVTVGNASETEDTFNLEINLTDEDKNSKKIEGAEYNIEVTRVSNGKNVTNTYYKNMTNDKGKLNIALPGSGNIQLKITQVKTATGYILDSEPKIITILRQDGTVQQVLQGYNEDTHTEVDALPYSSENKVLVNLTNKMSTERNIVEVKLTDIEETDIYIPNITMKLTNNQTNEEYTAVTDMSGVARFQIDDEDQGYYTYTISKVSELPSYYEDIPNVDISVHFNEDRHMDSVSDLWDSTSTQENPLYSLEPVTLVEEDGFADHKTEICLGAQVSAAYTYMLQVKLTDSETNAALEGATYDITITAGDVTRTITGRRTDANGLIETRIVLNDVITIEVTETESISKYKLDPATKEINLSYINNTLSLLDPDITDVTISGNKVIYTHKNLKKTSDDVLLDLTILKETVDGLPASGKLVRIYQKPNGNNYISTTQGYEVKGTKYGSWIEEADGILNPEPLEDSNTLDIKTTTDTLGMIVLKGLKINNIPTPGEAEFILYVVEYDNITGEDIESTRVKYKITYRYNEEKEVVEITNVESTWGNRLVKEKTFNGYEASIGYQSNIITTIYTDYDSVGNLAIDLKKFDKDETRLAGAKYDINVVRPDGTRLKKTVTVNDDDTIELEGIMVSVGTQIELVETEAPIGYAINEETEIITVTEIDETGEIYLELQGTNYNPQRAKLTKTEVYQTKSGSLKTEYELQLIDYELDTFKMKITALDATEKSRPIEGYSFIVTSTKGARKVTGSTDNKGIVEDKVGGNYANESVEYTITKNNAAQYYKDFTPITVRVDFDENGNVSSTTVTNPQADSNYGELENGKIWIIKYINMANGNDIEIEMYIEPNDPLKLEIETFDRTTGNKVSGEEYRLSPCINLSGTTTIDSSTQNAVVNVGYVLIGENQIYNITNTSTAGYEKIGNQQLYVAYDSNGDVIASETKVTTDNFVIETISGKYIKLKAYANPTLDINIKSIDKITGSEVTTGVKYKISSSSRESGTGDTGSTIKVGYVKPNQTDITYTIEQVQGPDNYEDATNKEIKVTYDQNGAITNVTTDSSNINIVSYQYNNIEIEIQIEPRQGIQIVNNNYFTGNPISGAEFVVTSETDRTQTASIGLTGITSILGDKLGEANSEVRYKVTQTKVAEGFAKIKDFEIIVSYGNNREITNVTATNNDNQIWLITRAIVPSTRNDEGYNGNDKGIVQIIINSYYDFRLNIENVDRADNNVKVMGTTYSVTSTIDTSGTCTTNASGIGTAHLDKTELSTRVVYTIVETSPADDYQKLEVEQIDVEVTFDDKGYVIPGSTKVVSGHGDEYATASDISSITDDVDRFTINVQITSNPKFRINITNVDRIDNSIKLPGTKYKVTSEEGNSIDDNRETDLNGNVTYRMLGSPKGKEVTYTIEEVYGSNQYQMIEEAVKIKVIFNDDGSVQSCNLIQGQTFATANTILPITTTFDKFGINVEIKNNVKLKIKIDNISTITDDDGNITVTKIKDVTYTATAVEVASNTNLNVDTSAVTDTNGQATLLMDKALSTKTIQYTIRETKKAVGYDWLESEIIIQVSFDSEGKMIDNSWSIVANSQGISANGFATITSVSINDFTINLEIENTPIKEFGIHLTALDMYTENPIDGVVADAYLTDDYGAASDGTYQISLVNQDKITSQNPTGNYLTTGIDRDNDGFCDLAVGEDYLTMGEYLEGTKTSRTLRVILHTVPNDYQNYANNTGKTQQIGILINLTFDDEGRITRTSLRTGLDSRIGWLADERFVSVESSGYGLNITLKFYPLLQVKLEAHDMYTDATLDSNLKLSTSTYPTSQLSTGDVIQEGYIGYTGTGYVGGAIYEVGSSHNYERAARIEAGIEPERERTFYLYENSKGAPNASTSYYQKYISKKDPDYYHSYRIASIKVLYNADGTIKEADVTEYRSSNNIKDGYIDLSWDGYKLFIKVKYAPTTKIVATAVDSVTNEPLGNIRLYPFGNGHSRYEYYSSDSGYETTSDSGTAGWTYWGANVPGTILTYSITPAFNGSRYDGYFLPGEIKVDVAYNEDGRISNAQVITQNQFQDALNGETTWEDTTVYLTIKFERKFNLKINKKDIYDSSQNLSTKFSIESNQNESENIYSGNVKTVGRIHAGETVKYTLSELDVIPGYLKLENIPIYVEFSKTGEVSKTYTDSAYQQYFEFVRTNPSNSDGVRINVTDLEINIKNKPVFSLDLNLTDAYYSNVKLEDITFTITNSKGDNASGGLVTDSNGSISTSVGPIYPNETITYTINQTSIANGYFQNTDTMEFTVKFNENGYIENYTVTKGSEVMTIKPNTYIGKRKVTVDIVNEPKYVNIGIVKKDATTKEGINDVEFKVEVTDIISGSTVAKSYITQANADGDGTVAGQVDDVEKSMDKRAVTYKISEINVPNTYRKIQDIEIEVIYNEDGSILSYDIISNPSEVGVKVFAKGSNIEKVNGLPAHIKLTIDNDNRYDLIIKNEDINYPLLGIEGTTYNVSIDEKTYVTPATDSEGKTGLYKLEGSGIITIRISENKIGSGYRSDNQNDTIITLEKGETVYSLKEISNSNNINATVSVDETQGLVTVTFKNETKLELDMVKNNKDTKEVLENIRFEITSQEIDDYGDSVGSPTYITQQDINDITDEEGKLYFDLGVTQQNKTIKYTFKEVETPEGYIPLDEINVTAKFDMYGQLVETIDDSFNATIATNAENKNGIVVIIGNSPEGPEGPEGEIINPPYTVKVVTEDSQTNKRINGSTFNIEVTKDPDNIQVIDPIEGAVTEDITESGYLIEKGATVISGLTADGDINIYVDQTGTAEGYTYSNKTSATIKVNVEYQAQPDTTETKLVITPLDDDGYEVVVDNTNREIVIKVKNDPGVTLNIYKYYKEESEDEQGNTIYVEKPVGGAKFTVTSEIQTSSTTVTTELNGESKSTDEEGNTNIGIGEPYAGKTILYTLKETVPEKFKEIDDIVLLVKYDTSGYVKYTEVLSNQDITETTGDAKGTREIGIKVKNEREIEEFDYNIVLRKHSIEDGEYSYLIPGATYEFKIQEEYGTTRTWTGITDENGEIKSPAFSGYGRITVTYTELSAPDGYEIDNSTHSIEVKKMKETGKFSIITTDENYEFSEDNKIVYVDPQDDLQKDRYSIILNKVDGNTNKRITNNTAIFDISMIEEQTIIKDDVDSDGNLTQTEEIVESEFELGTISTNLEGKANLGAVKMPDEEGEYKLKFTEIQAPEGYIADEEGYTLKVTFAENEKGTLEIAQIENLSTDNLDILKTDKQIIAVNVKNITEEDIIKENEYSLDITKVDAETGDAIENTAIFKVWIPDEQSTAVYTETSVTRLGPGKLDYCYIEQDKDYTVRLTHMTKPTESEFDDTTETITHTYTFNEVVAPEGYAKIDDDMVVDIVFKQDADTREIYIDDITTDAPDYINIKTSTPCSTQTKVEIDILNGLSEQKEFTVNYDANDNGEGTIVPASQIKELDVDLTLDTTEPVRDGYIFKGWATLPTATTPDFAPGDPYTLNQDITLYAVWEEKLYLRSKEYLIGDAPDGYKRGDMTEYKDGDLYISRVSPQTNLGVNVEFHNRTTINDFKNNIITNADTIEILEKDGSLASEKIEKQIGIKDGQPRIEIKDNIMKTYMTLKLTKGEQEIVVTVIVTGDIDGDGQLTSSDLSCQSTEMLNYIFGRGNLTEIEFKALDVNYDGKLDTQDTSLATNVYTGKNKDTGEILDF